MNINDSFPKSLLEMEIPVLDAVHHLGNQDQQARGAIHTRPEIAEFILDLVDWIPEQIHPGMRLLEPSAGHGDFLIPAITRLLKPGRDWPLADLAGSIRAVEVSKVSLDECKNQTADLLEQHGFGQPQIAELTAAWFIHADFLTLPLPTHFTHVVGNPPYIRLESLPKQLLKLYRARWTSLFDRADLYVAFIEKSLSLLATEGRLGFICADRWMKNRYGGPLRSIVAGGFHLDSYVDFTDCPAFHDTVAAYPAVTVIRRGTGTQTRTAYRPNVDRNILHPLVAALTGRISHPKVQSISNVVTNANPWILDDGADRLKMIRTLEKRFNLIEDAGCKVGIGVATGADRIYIGSEADLDVESSRRLPLVMTRDIARGTIHWQGKWVLNPFEDDGRLVKPADYPRFRKYIEMHSEALRRRNVAVRNPHAWFRTIDRIHYQLTRTPKLLIPDIKGSAHVVLDEGNFYPHHNLYFITSVKWDLRALQVILQSRVAHAFIAAYSPRMRGDFLRFQAQYLRRIRLPQWEAVSMPIRESLVAATLHSASASVDRAIQSLFQLSDSEWELLAI